MIVLVNCEAFHLESVDSHFRHKGFRKRGSKVKVVQFILGVLSGKWL